MIRAIMPYIQLNEVCQTASKLGYLKHDTAIQYYILYNINLPEHAFERRVWHAPGGKTTGTKQPTLFGKENKVNDLRYLSMMGVTNI